MDGKRPEGHRTIRYPIAALAAAGLVSAGAADSVRFAEDTVHAYEGDGSALVVVERTGASESSAVVRLRTRELSAERRRDFRGKTRILKWEKGESGPKAWSVRLRDDGIEEGDESFVVEIDRVRGSAVSASNVFCEVSIVSLDGEGLPSHVQQTPAFKAAKGALARNLPSGSTEFDEGGSTRNVDRSRTVAGIGDVDGDGYDDFAIGEPGEFVAGYFGQCECPECLAGWVWVVFGGETIPAELDESDPRTIRIFSPDTACREDGLRRPNGFGSDAMGAGDLNGDGYSDFLIAVPLSGTFPGHTHGPGAIHVVFGGADFRTRAHDLSTPDGIAGTRIDGNGTLGDVFANRPLGMIAGPSERIASSGLPSLVVGYSGTFLNRIDGLHGAWPPVIDLAELNDPVPAPLFPGIRHAGIEPSGIGDFDGDGWGDYAVSASSPNEVSPKAAIRYGGPSAIGRTTTIHVQKFHTDTWYDFDWFAEQAAGIGDTNGDGYAEMIVAGGKSAYLVFGHGNPAESFSVGTAAGNPAPVLAAERVVRIGHQTFWPGRNSDHNTSVSPAGDVNGDGLADFLLGFRSSATLPDTGFEQVARTYLILGGSIDPATTDAIDDIDAWIDGGGGARGSRLDGYGGSSDVAGDVDGDGLSEFLVAVRRESVIDHEATLFSYTETPAADSTVTLFVPNGDAPSVPMGTTGTAREGVSWTRCALDFAGGWSSLRADTSLEQVTLHRGANGVSNLPVPHAAVAWRLQSERTGFGTLDVELKYLSAELPLELAEEDIEVLHATSANGPWRRLPTTRSPESDRVTARLDEADAGAENWFALGETLRESTAPCEPGDADCDGVDDGDAIAAGVVADCNGNGVPDRAETNRAMLFDGVDDWLEGGTHPDFRLDGDLLISLRINVSGDAPRNESLPVLVKGDPDADDFEYALSAVTTDRNYYTLLFETTNAGGDTYRILDIRSTDAGSHLVYDRWYHIAVTLRRDNTLPFGTPYVSFHLNGRQAASCISDLGKPCPTPGLGTAGTYPLLIGRWPDANRPMFQGMLDDITMWRGAQSSGLVPNTLAQSKQTGNEAGMTTWLRFDRDRNLPTVRNEKAGATSAFVAHGSPRIVAGAPIGTSLADADGDGLVDSCGDCPTTFFRNPVRDGFPGSGLGDPMITWFRGRYVLSGTTSALKGYLGWSSRDLVNWSVDGLILDGSHTMIWQGHWAQTSFYGADMVVRTNPDGTGRFFMMYGAGLQDEPVATRIGVASSPSSFLSFEPLVPAASDPPDRYGPGMIYDGNYVFDEDGTPYAIMSGNFTNGNPPNLLELRPVIRELESDLAFAKPGVPETVVAPDDAAPWTLASLAREAPENVVAGGWYGSAELPDLVRSRWQWRGSDTPGTDTFRVAFPSESDTLRIDWGDLGDADGTPVEIRRTTAGNPLVAAGTAVSFGSSLFEFDPVPAGTLRVSMTKAVAGPLTVARAQAFSTDGATIGFSIAAETAGSELRAAWGWTSKPGNSAESLVVDMVEPALVDEVRVFWEAASGGATFQTFVSRDAETWESVGASRSAATGRGERVRFSPQEARYVRIDIAKSPTGSVAIGRIEAFGGGEGADHALSGNVTASDTNRFAAIMEGPAAFKRGDTWYMLFAGNAYNTHDYGIGYATAPAVEGPWTMAPENPIGSKKFHSGIVGPGVCDMILSPDGTEMWGIYHAYHTPYGNFTRSAWIDRLEFRSDGSLFLVGPTALPQVVPSNAPNLSPLATIAATSNQAEAALLADEDANTAWTSDDTDTQTVTLDLGGLFEAKSLVVDWEPGRFATDWFAEVSTDGTDWVLATDRSGGTIEYLRYPFDDSFPARYVRMTLTGAAGGADAFGIRELEVRGERCPLSNVADDATVPTEAKGDGTSLAIDLHGVYGIEGVRAPLDAANAIMLELSADGAVWRDIAFDAVQGDGATFLHLGSSPPARFVRLSAETPVSALDVFALPRRLEPVVAGGAITASENAGGAPAAFDGDMATGWSASATDAWIGFDAGRPRTVRGLDVRWEENEWPGAFDLMASEDGEDFFPVAGVIASGGEEANALVETPAVTARYWRLRSKGDAPDTIRLLEWSVLAEID